jgi:hypothetical protein
LESFIVTGATTLQNAFLQCDDEPPAALRNTGGCDQWRDDEEDTPHGDLQKWQHITLVSGKSPVQDDENLPPVRDARGSWMS